MPTPSPVRTDDLGALPSGPRDPVGIVLEQNEDRLQDLVPVRMGRMLESPFAYYRGTAANMAADLATTPESGIHVLSCGDAHISNFGFFASPERALMFDLNDFDEGGAAPWEWDLKRLVTSAYLAARDVGASQKQASKAARKTSRSYRRTAARLQELTALERYYFGVDTDDLRELLSGKHRSALDKTTSKARRRTSAQVLDKFTVVTDSGERRLADQPPLTTHTTHATREQMQRLWGDYVATVRDDVRYLLQQFTLVDYVLRVVGVGSVGSRCYILYLEDRGGAPLFLQAKEAGPSVLATYGGVPQSLDGIESAGLIGSHGHRVVAAQRVLQAHSDPFLGWLRGYAGDQGESVPADFYFRQFKDMKGSIDLSRLAPQGVAATGRACAALLARAHSQSPASDRVAALCDDGGDDLDEVFAQFARGYAEVCIEDYEALKAAADRGDVPVTYGT